jgi:hypothetical protein
VKKQYKLIWLSALYIAAMIFETNINTFHFFIGVGRGERWVDGWWTTFTEFRRHATIFLGAGTE